MGAPVVDLPSGRLQGKWTPEGDVAMFRSVPKSTVSPGLSPLTAVPVMVTLPPMTGMPEVPDVCRFSTPT